MIQSPPEARTLLDLFTTCEMQKPAIALPERGLRVCYRDRAQVEVVAARPQHIHITKTMPRTATGRIQRRLAEAFTRVAS